MRPPDYSCDLEIVFLLAVPQDCLPLGHHGFYHSTPFTNLAVPQDRSGVPSSWAPWLLSLHPITQHGTLRLPSTPVHGNIFCNHETNYQNSQDPNCIPKDWRSTKSTTEDVDEYIKATAVEKAKYGGKDIKDEVWLC